MIDFRYVVWQLEDKITYGLTKDLKEAEEWLDYKWWPTCMYKIPFIVRNPKPEAFVVLIGTTFYYSRSTGCIEAKKEGEKEYKVIAIIEYTQWPGANTLGLCLSTMMSHYINSKDLTEQFIKFNEPHTRR